jgi:release factor glutamine methyltransferase
VKRREALRALAARLERAGVDSPEQDAEALLLHALRIPRDALWRDPETRLTEEDAAILDSLAEARERRTPLQLLLGEIPFHGVSLAVAPGVFIPRPETEGLVEAVLGALRAGPGTADGSAFGPLSRPAGTLLELGTGTGAIAVALLHALPEWRGVAVDRSRAAVDLAGRNAARNGVGARLLLLEADFLAAGFTPPGAPFDAVVSNPPYVRSSDIPTLPPEVAQHDPREALDGGADGLDALRRMASGLSRWLRPGGLLALEIGADQADDVVGLMRPLAQAVRVLPDLAGRPRVLLGRLKGRDA